MTKIKMVRSALRSTKKQRMALLKVKTSRIFCTWFSHVKATILARAIVGRAKCVCCIVSGVTIFP